MTLFHLYLCGFAIALIFGLAFFERTEGRASIGEPDMPAALWFAVLWPLVLVFLAVMALLVLVVLAERKWRG